MTRHDYLNRRVFLHLNPTITGTVREVGNVMPFCLRVAWDCGSGAWYAAHELNLCEVDTQPDKEKAA